MINHDYIINVGKSQNDCTPLMAASTKEEAIEKAKVLIEQHTYEYAEVVFMPESDINTNEVIWTSWFAYEEAGEEC